LALTTGGSKPPMTQAEAKSSARRTSAWRLMESNETTQSNRFFIEVTYQSAYFSRPYGFCSRERVMLSLPIGSFNQDCHPAIGYGLIKGSTH
jgi:hypothetical protein